jgi:hypothetical protein
VNKILKKNVLSAFLSILFVFAVVLSAIGNATEEQEIIETSIKVGVEDDLVNNDDWFYYPKLDNYAPKGMPDFDQRQDNSWRNQKNMAMSFCGPTALSNVLWYLDSRYSDSSGYPGDGIDIFPLVQDYNAPGNYDPGPYSDDHNFNNVNDLLTTWNPANGLFGNEFIEKIAWYTDNDGVRTGGHQTGSSPSGIYEGCVQWIEDVGLNDSIDIIIHDTTREDSFNEIVEHIENDDYVILNLGFYTSSGITRGNHWVTVAGISRTLNKIAISDPYYDFTNITTDYTEHNNVAIVSHDIFTINTTSPFPQRSSWWLEDYEPGFAPNTKTMIIDAIVIAPIIDNQPPEKPTISGPESGKIETEYTYYGISSDNNGDQIFYLFDWGDGSTSFILGPYSSGIECSASNIWFEKETYEIKVKAIDIHGAESDWSDPLTISIPKINNKMSFFEYFKIRDFVNNGIILILAFPTEFYEYETNYTFLCQGRGYALWITPRDIHYDTFCGAILDKEKFYGIANPTVVFGIKVR